MTGRERLQSILNHQPVDRPSWTTLVDSQSRSPMPPEFRQMCSPQLCQYLGCDILQFGNFDLPSQWSVTSPARFVQPEIEVTEAVDEDDLLTRTTQTEWGTLTATFKRGHPVKYPVESLAELRVLRNLWFHSRYEEVEGMEESHARFEAAFGEDGLFIPTLNPSPVQQLLQLDMGVAGFYWLLQDYQTEMEELLAVMQEARRQEYEIVARRTPAPAIIPVENTSSTLISPKLYRRYSLPQVRDYVEIGHKHGKKVILHMCGLLSNLLPEIRETGLDGINALTPPPVGDTPFAEVLDACGEDFIIFGGVLDEGVFQAPTVSAEEIRQALDKLYTPTIRQANLVLWLVADGLPTPLERFLVVRDWFEEKGQP